MWILLFKKKKIEKVLWKHLLKNKTKKKQGKQRKIYTKEVILTNFKVWSKFDTVSWILWTFFQTFGVFVNKPLKKKQH